MIFTGMVMMSARSLREAPGSFFREVLLLRGKLALSPV